MYRFGKEVTWPFFVFTKSCGWEVIPEGDRNEETVRFHVFLNYVHE